MKRITVSLPDELAEKVRRAAGGERRVSSYVAAALEDYAERENLEEVLAAWNAESPVPDEVPAAGARRARPRWPHRHVRAG